MSDFDRLQYAQDYADSLKSTGDKPLTYQEKLKQARQKVVASQAYYEHLSELCLLLEKHPEVGRIIELIDKVKYSLT